MFKSIHIKNFRGLKNLKIDSLSRINLFTGNNNVGKTALLEGTFLLAGATNITLAVVLQRMRGIRDISGPLDEILDVFFPTLFFELDTKREFSVEGRTTNDQIYRIEIELHEESLRRIELNGGNGQLDSDIDTIERPNYVLEQRYYSPNNPSPILSQLSPANSEEQIAAFRRVPGDVSPPFNAHFIAGRHVTNLQEEASLYGRILRSKSGYEKALLDVLRIFEPNLTQIGSFPVGTSPLLWADVIELPKYLPMNMLGDGLNRILGILLRIISSENGMVFIDEIDNGIHYSILPQVWQAISEASQAFNVQLFATTHSRECAVAAHEALTNASSYDLGIHRLEKRDGKNYAVTYDIDSMDASVEMDLEIR